MHLLRSVGSFVGMALALGLTPVHGAITFSKIVDQNTPMPGGPGNFGGFGVPSFGGGNIAFAADDATGHSGVYSTLGGLHAVADENTPIPGGTGSFLSFFQVSFDGEHTAFNVFNGSGTQSGVYADVGGLNVVADLNTPIPGGTGNFTAVARPVIGSGNTAFVGFGSSSQRGVYTDAGGLNVVADKSTPIPGGTGTFTSFHDNIFSFDGQSVAFLGTGPSSQAGYYSNVGGTLHVIADKSTPIPGGTGNFGSFGDISADDGFVAFEAGDSFGGQEGIYTNIGGLSLIADLTTPVPDGIGTFTGFTRGPALDDGNVAFMAASEAGDQRGLYAYFEGEVLNVIDRDDTLDDRSIASLNMSTEALDGDQLAFRVEFTDFTKAIYVATIPEPATLMLLSLGSLALLRRNRVRQ